MRARRARGQLPLITEQVLEETVVPLRRVACPDNLQPAGNRVIACAGAERVLPPETLLFDRGALGFATYVLCGICGTVGLAECVPARDKGDCLLVVHGHARKRLSDVPGGRHGVRVAIRAFGVHVDEAHLHRAEGICEHPVPAVALVAEPRVLRPPVDVLFGLPHVLAPTAETKSLEAHRLQGAVPGEDHQVGPGELSAVLLLDGPKQAARLVKAGVVGPAVEGGETLRTRPGTSPAVVDAVRAGAVPRHTDDKRAIVTEISRPPILRRRQDLDDFRLHRRQVKALKLRCVIERLAHGVD